MPTRPRTNPRRHPCTWCNAAIAAPCVGPAGRELTWYHAPRVEAAEQDPGLPDPRRAPDPHPTHDTTPQPRRPLRRLPPRHQPAPLGTDDPPAAATRHERAADWLHHQLTTLGGTAPAHDLIQAARIAGYSRTTLHRARQRLHIQTEKQSYLNGWTWNLPAQPLEPSIPDSAIASLTEAAQLTLKINTRAKRARP